MEKKNLLREETIDFAIEVSDTVQDIKGCSVYINQLIKSSSSIGANLHEAKYAQSKADFINKLEIAEKGRTNVGLRWNFYPYLRYSLLK